MAVHEGFARYEISNTQRNRVHSRELVASAQRALSQARDLCQAVQERRGRHDFFHHLAKYVRKAPHMRRYLLLTGGEGDPLEMETEDHSEGIVLRVSGEVDLANISRLKTALQPALTNCRNIILDVSDLGYVDSTGLHVLFDANKVLRQHSCQMIVVGPRPGIAKVFSIVDLDKSIPVVTSTDEAMALLRTKSSAAASDG